MADNKDSNPQTDLFAPPSKDELAMFAPPTKEEMASNSISDMGGGNAIGGALKDLGAGVMDALPSKEEWKAAGSGAAQTATFGASDEIGAAGDVALDKILGNKTGKSYREYQKLREAANKKDQQDYPGAYLGGEIGAGIATVPLLPELGGSKLVGLAKGVKGLGGLIEAGEATAPELKALGKDAPGMLTRMTGKGAASAIEGAPLGAVMGTAGSSNDLSNPKELAKDAASGMAMASLGGMAIGGGLKAAQMGAEYAPELAKKWDFTRKMGTAYDIGKTGQNFDTSLGKDITGKQLQDIPNQMTDKIMEVDAQLGQKVGDSLDPAINPNAAKPINIDDELKASSGELFNTFNTNPTLLQTVDPKTRKLIMKASFGQNGLGDLTQLEANALKKSLYDLGSKLNGMSSDAAALARQQGHSVASALDGALKATNQEYADAATKFSDFRSKVPEVLLQPELPADKRTKMLGDLKNKATDLFKGTSKVLGNAALPGAPALNQRTGLNEVVNNLQELNKTNPEAVAALGGTPEQVGKNWKALADKMAVLKQSQGFDPNEKMGNLLTGLVTAGEGESYSMANRAGRLVNATGQSKPVQMASKLFSGTDDALMTLAQRMKNNQIPGVGTGLSFYGEALEKALNNKSEAGKNAVLFKLMQIPEYREMLRSEGYSDNGSQQNGQQQ